MTTQTLDAKAAKRELYRDLILTAAERSFADRGYAEVKVQDIASAADLSLATLYNTFAGKQAIYHEVHRRRLHELVEAALAVAGTADSHLGNLLAGIEAYVRYFAEHPDYLRMHLREGNSWATEAGIERGLPSEIWRRGIEMFEEILSQAIAAGEVVDEDPALIARVATATQQVALARWMEGGLREAPEQLSERVRHLFLRSFATELPEPKGR